MVDGLNFDMRTFILKFAPFSCGQMISFSSGVSLKQENKVTELEDKIGPIFSLICFQFFTIFIVITQTGKQNTKQNLKIGPVSVCLFFFQFCFLFSCFKKRLGRTGEDVTQWER